MGLSLSNLRLGNWDAGYKVGVLGLKVYGLDSGFGMQGGEMREWRWEDMAAVPKPLLLMITKLWSYNGY